MLSESFDSRKPVKQRRTSLLLFEQLQRDGFGGGYDSARRYVNKWRKTAAEREGKAFFPLSFDPGEAFQFDCGYKPIELGGVPVWIKVAYLRESLAMVLAAHARVFDFFFGGACRKGIYDNLKTVVSKVLMGKERIFNRQCFTLGSQHLFERVACIPAAGWENGQVENRSALSVSVFSISDADLPT